MPILITHGDAGVFGQGAHDAGYALGRSQRLAQQRQIDANFIADRLAAREELTRIRALEDLERSRNRGGGGSGGPRGASRSDIRSIIEGYDRDRKDDQVVESVAEKKRQARETESAGLLHALDAKFKDDEANLTYQYTRDQLLSGKSVPQKVLEEIGIVSPDEKKEDVDTQYQPKTNQERLFRRSLEQGKPSDIAAFLDQRESSSKFGPASDDDPLTMDALAARTQLDAFVSTISDRNLLREYKQDLKDAGVSDEAIQLIEERDADLAETEMKVKAPAAFEQIVTAFGPQLQAMQDREGRVVTMSEKRKLLGGIISQTADSYGLTVDQIGQYIRENDETRRVSEMLVQKAQEAITEIAQNQGPTGSEQEFGGEPLPAQSTLPSRPRRPDRAVDHGG